MKHTTFETLTALELTDEQVRSVLERHRALRRLNQAAALIVVAVLALAVAALVPPSRAELADALRAVLQGGSLPGEPVTPAQLPAWLRAVPFAAEGQPRVIAQAGGERLLVFRQAGGALCFDFGGVGVCDAPEQDLFADGPVALFGPTAASDGERFVLWGLTLASVDSVELVLAEGASIRTTGNGAFGIAIGGTRAPVRLLAYDAGGNRVADIDVRQRWARRPAL